MTVIYHGISTLEKELFFDGQNDYGISSLHLFTFGCYLVFVQYSNEYLAQFYLKVHLH
jgi:hypothetical protein